MQSGVILSHLMAALTYIRVVHRSRIERRRSRAQLKHGAAATTEASQLDPDTEVALPQAAVAAPPPLPSAPTPHLPDELPDIWMRDAQPGRAAGGGAGPCGEGTERGRDSSGGYTALDAADARTAPDAVADAGMFAGTGTSKLPGDAGPAEHRRGVQHLPDSREKGGEPEPWVVANAAFVQPQVKVAEEDKPGGRAGGRGMHGSGSDLPGISEPSSEPVLDTEGRDGFGSALSETAAEVAVRQADEAAAQGPWGGGPGRVLWKVWSDVKEDPRVGFRYVLRAVRASLLCAASNCCRDCRTDHDRGAQLC